MWNAGSTRLPGLQVIVVGNEKGGSGKTTVAMHSPSRSRNRVFPLLRSTSTFAKRVSHTIWKIGLPG